MIKSLVLLPQEEWRLRIKRLREALSVADLEAALISDNANLYYLTGRVFDGYVYVPLTGKVMFFVRRPVDLVGDGVVYIRKPEQIAGIICQNVPANVGFELDVMPWSVIERIKAVFPGCTALNVSQVMRRTRGVKTAFEIAKMKLSGEKQERVYRMVPKLYRFGMSDLELQVEIERVSRLEGCLGQFRICGGSMELFMGNVLVGDNADNPTPYDFAMGGAGLDASLPVGCNGSVIHPGESVMVDVNGNYTGYMTDMTRSFSLGKVSDEAMRAHECSREICEAVRQLARPGVEARVLFGMAENMARDAGLDRYFMGHAQKAGFVGHGLGIEINESPVIAPRSKDIIEEGNTFAVEPKFVIPGVGAVGIENTYVVGAEKTECITSAPEEIIDLR